MDLVTGSLAADNLLAEMLTLFRNFTFRLPPEAPSNKKPDQQENAASVKHILNL
jgi:hypothetical protein